MGCTTSISRYVAGKRKHLPVAEVVVFVPPMWIPKGIDFQRHLGGVLSPYIVEKLSSLRTQIVLMAEDCFKHPNFANMPTENGGCSLSNLQQALEAYLPLLLGLTRIENHLEDIVKFKWENLEDDHEGASLSSPWFELLAILRMMAMLSLSEANLMLIPKESMDVRERKVSEDCKKDAIELLLKASGYLCYSTRYILVHMPPNVKKMLPRDLKDVMLDSISIQALGQAPTCIPLPTLVLTSMISILEKFMFLVIEMQLGLAVESEQATLSVKRRLACEQVSYFAQAHYCLSGCDFSKGYGKKHILFIKWKYLEAKAAAYYYHGQILDKGNEAIDHMNAVSCLLAAEELLVDSKRACLTYCLASPVTRAPPAWGVMNHLHQKIPEVALKKTQMYGYLFSEAKAPHVLPDLPDFPLSLKPDDYEFPAVDPSWNSEIWEPHIQTLKEHLKEEEEGREME